MEETILNKQVFKIIIERKKTILHSTKKAAKKLLFDICYFV